MPKPPKYTPRGLEEALSSPLMQDLAAKTQEDIGSALQRALDAFSIIEPRRNLIAFVQLLALAWTIRQRLIFMRLASGEVIAKEATRIIVGSIGREPDADELLDMTVRIARRQAKHQREGETS